MPKNKTVAHKLSLSVQYPDHRLSTIVPRPLIRRWVQAALLAPAQFTIRFVNTQEGRELNRTYRGKDYATNVLTFAYTADDDMPPDNNDDTITQADIILCTDVLETEAAQQHKTIIEHTAHLVIHGALHAQGYDHENDTDATEMETLEITVLTELGFPNPYTERS